MCLVSVSKFMLSVFIFSGILLVDCVVFVCRSILCECVMVEIFWMGCSVFILLFVCMIDISVVLVCIVVWIFVVEIWLK